MPFYGVNMRDIMAAKVIKDGMNAFLEKGFLFEYFYERNEAGNPIYICRFKKGKEYIDWQETEDGEEIAICVRASEKTSILDLKALYPKAFRNHFWNTLFRKPTVNERRSFIASLLVEEFKSESPDFFGIKIIVDKLIDNNYGIGKNSEGISNRIAQSSNLCFVMGEIFVVFGIFILVGSDRKKRRCAHLCGLHYLVHSHCTAVSSGKLKDLVVSHRDEIAQIAKKHIEKSILVYGVIVELFNRVYLVGDNVLTGSLSRYEITVPCQVNYRILGYVFYLLDRHDLAV